MKTSNKWLLSMALVIFLGSAFLMIATRIFLGHEPAYVESKISNSEKSRAVDSSVAVLPGDEVNWTRVTLGLRRSFRRGIIEDSSIFKDLHMTIIYNDCGTRPFFKPLNESIICRLVFTYHKTEYDSTKNKDPGHPANDYVYIHVLKYKKKQPSVGISESRKISFNAKKSLAGVWEYWMYHGARCEWTKGRWSTMVQVPLESCGNDSAKAIELRDQIRDRLFAYYKKLE